MLQHQAGAIPLFLSKVRPHSLVQTGHGAVSTFAGATPIEPDPSSLSARVHLKLSATRWNKNSACFGCGDIFSPSPLRGGVGGGGSNKELFTCCWFSSGPYGPTPTVIIWLDRVNQWPARLRGQKDLMRRRHGALDYPHEAGNDGGGDEGLTTNHGFLLGLDPSIHDEISMREVGVGWSRTLCLQKGFMGPRVKPEGEGFRSRFSLSPLRGGVGGGGSNKELFTCCWFSSGPCGPPPPLIPPRKGEGDRGADALDKTHTVITRLDWVIQQPARRRGRKTWCAVDTACWITRMSWVMTERGMEA